MGTQSSASAKRRVSSSLAAFAALPLLAAFVACADSGFEVGEDGFDVPATLDEVRPQAEAIAKEWQASAYLWGIGGGYTILDSQGRGVNHSFRFYAPARELLLDLHLFAGSHWGEEQNRPRGDAPAPLAANVDMDALVPSAQAIRIAIDAAIDSGFAARLDTTAISARLLSHPVWPERDQAGAVTDSIAWRVDFLEERYTGGVPTWWSLFRVYLHPTRGEVFSLTRDPPQIYPNL